MSPPFVVMKFGGTSVADAAAIRQAGTIVAAERARTNRAPVVVVSAMGGVTDQLLSLARAAIAGDIVAVKAGLEDLERRHADAATALLDARGAAALDHELAGQFAELRAVLTAVATLREVSPRSLDGIAATGELLSSRIVAAALAAAGLHTVWIDARRTIVTNGAHTCAAPLHDATCEAISREITPALNAGLVPVVGGYVGATPEGVTTTLGRGGSDYSAAIVAAALRDACLRSAASTADSQSPIANSQSPIANPQLPISTPQSPISNPQSSLDNQSAICNLQSEIQIWTDVDGMLTADPRIVDAPRVVSRLSFGEASELAYFGAKVLHPSTILPAVERDIPVRIRNSRRPDSPGTLITSSPSLGGPPIAAIACKRNITVIEVTSTRMLMAHGFLRRLFEVFERCGTPVDVVTTSEVSVSVTVDDDRQLDAIVEGLREFAEVLVEREMAILCVVGDGLRADPALAVRLLGSLEGFSLRMVSQAASRRNLTMVLYDRDVAAAMTRLHRAWFTRPAQALTQGSAGV